MLSPQLEPRLLSLPLNLQLLTLTSAADAKVQLPSNFLTTWCTSTRDSLTSIPPQELLNLCKGLVAVGGQGRVQPEWGLGVLREVVQQQQFGQGSTAAVAEILCWVAEEAVAAAAVGDALLQNNSSSSSRSSAGGKRKKGVGSTSSNGAAEVYQMGVWAVFNDLAKEPSDLLEVVEALSQIAGGRPTSTNSSSSSSNGGGLISSNETSSSSSSSSSGFAGEGGGTTTTTNTSSSSSSNSSSIGTRTCAIQAMLWQWLQAKGAGQLPTEQLLQLLSHLSSLAVADPPTGAVAATAQLWSNTVSAHLKGLLTKSQQGAAAVASSRSAAAAVTDSDDSFMEGPMSMNPMTDVSGGDWDSTGVVGRVGRGLATASAVLAAAVAQQGEAVAVNCLPLLLQLMISESTSSSTAVAEETSTAPPSGHAISRPSKPAAAAAAAAAVVAFDTFWQQLQQLATAKPQLFMLQLGLTSRALCQVASAVPFPVQSYLQISKQLSLWVEKAACSTSATATAKASATASAAQAVAASRWWLLHLPSWLLQHADELQLPDLVLLLDAAVGVKERCGTSATTLSPGSWLTGNSGSSTGSSSSSSSSWRESCSTAASAGLSLLPPAVQCSAWEAPVLPPAFHATWTTGLEQHAVQLAAAEKETTSRCSMLIAVAAALVKLHGTAATAGVLQEACLAAVAAVQLEQLPVGSLVDLLWLLAVWSGEAFAAHREGVAAAAGEGGGNAAAAAGRGAGAAVATTQNLLQLASEVCHMISASPSPSQAISSPGTVAAEGSKEVEHLTPPRLSQTTWALALLKLRAEQQQAPFLSQQQQQQLAQWLCSAWQHQQHQQQQYGVALGAPSNVNSSLKQQPQQQQQQQQQQYNAVSAAALGEVSSSLKLQPQPQQPQQHEQQQQQLKFGPTGAAELLWALGVQSPSCSSERDAKVLLLPWEVVAVAAQELQEGWEGVAAPVAVAGAVGLGVLLSSYQQQQQEQQEVALRQGGAWRPVDTSLSATEGRITAAAVAAAATAAAEKAAPVAEEALQQLTCKLIAAATAWPLELQLQLLAGLLLVKHDCRSMAVMLQPGYKLLQPMGEAAMLQAAAEELLLNSTSSSGSSSSSSSLHEVVQLSRLQQQQRQRLEKDLKGLCQSFYTRCCKALSKGSSRKQVAAAAAADARSNSYGWENERKLSLVLVSMHLLKAAGWQLGRKKVQALLGPAEKAAAVATASSGLLQLLQQVRCFVGAQLPVGPAWV